MHVIVAWSLYYNPSVITRKTLIETKNHTLKCLKWHYSTVHSMKNVAVQCWRRMGHLPSFCVPTVKDLTAQESPPPGICHPRQKKMLICPPPPPFQGGGLGAGGIDWCITHTLKLLGLLKFKVVKRSAEKKNKFIPCVWYHFLMNKSWP